MVEARYDGAMGDEGDGSKLDMAGIRHRGEWLLRCECGCTMSAMFPFGYSIVSLEAAR